MVGNKIINSLNKIESNNKNIPSVFHLCKSIRFGRDSLKGTRKRKTFAEENLRFDSSGGEEIVKNVQVKHARETIGQIVSLSFSREVEIRR